MTTKRFRVTRRDLLTGIGITAGLSAFGCSSSESGPTSATGAAAGSGGRSDLDGGSMSAGGANGVTGGTDAGGAGMGGGSGGASAGAGGVTGTGGATGGTTADGGADGGDIVPQDMPSYMKGMADFEVRTLSTVTAGFATMYAALPAEWKQTGQPNGANNVFLAWSGGAADVARLRLFVHGGGHNDSSNNGIYIYDFSGDTAPAGWSVAKNSLSALSAVTPATNTYGDGKPTAIHSYNQLWFDPNRNRFYRFGGSGFSPGGGGISAAFYYDFAAAEWSPFFSDARIGSSLGSALAGSPDGTELLYLASNKTPVFTAVSNGTLTPYGDPLSGSEESGFVLALDTKRSNVAKGTCRYVAFYHDPAGPNVKVIEVDWSAKTFTVTTQALGGTDAGDLESAGACVAYDAQRDSFWVFANATELNDGIVSSIYEVSASTFAVKKTALKAPIQALAEGRGGYNRHIWFPAWRIIGTVHAHDQPVSIIKVP